MKRLLVWLSHLWRAGNGRIVAAAILTVFTLLLNFPELPPFKSARLTLFDQYQYLFPRQPQSSPAVIVAIDEETLAALGQWPWPRNYFAALLDAISALKPAAVGLDIIMPEPDHASPEAISESRSDLPESIHKVLLGIRSNDHLFAQSLASTPAVLGAAGFKFKTSATLEGLRTKTVAVQGSDPLPWLNAYPYVLASLPEFQAAAHGQALLSSDSEHGIVRRVALLSNLNGVITPGLALEMLRVANAAPQIIINSGIHGLESVTVSTQQIPLQSNGEAWVHFSEFSEQRFISAASLLKNEVPPERIAGKLVLIGLTGLGLQDFITTPLGDRRPGVEIHAQLIESFTDGHFLARPWWMHWLELGIVVIGGLMLIWVVPNANEFSSTKRKTEQRSVTHTKQQNLVQKSETLHTAEQKKESLEHTSSIKPKLTEMLILLFLSLYRTSWIKPRFIVWLVIFMLVSLLGAGVALFYWRGLLFDAANPFIALSVVFCSLLFSILVETDIQRTLLMNLFSRHVSKDVAEAVWNDRYDFMEGNRPRPKKTIATVLFTDLQNFTTISENMEPETLMNWLNEYMEAMAQIVNDHHGLVNKYIGDAVMAIFGVPITRNLDEEIYQDAKNAVDCALAMSQELIRLNNQWKEQGKNTIVMRVGIYTGSLVAGSLGSSDRLEYTVIGDTVNIASRLESFDKSRNIDPDGVCRILVGDTTVEAIQGKFDTAFVDSVALKGKNNEIKIYQITRKLHD